ncbi:MAG: hypothetical protein QG656_457 [Candidatus Hydrogenedentes bacterium]|nr:hypothetical protein [Candidatus Hydrogenedentota bacterium]
MKKLYWISAVVFLTAMAAPTASSALELEVDCNYMVDPETGFDNGGTAMQLILSVLTWLPISGQTWADMDIELIGGLYGDGIPDQYQMAMLAALLCSFELKEVDLINIRNQFNTNLSRFESISTQVQNIANIAPTAGPLMISAAQGLLAELPPAALSTVVNLPDPGNTMTQFLNYVDSLGDDIVGTYATVFTVMAPMIPNFGGFFGGMYGLSAEMQASMDNFLSGITDVLGQMDAAETLLTQFIADYGPSGANVLSTQTLADLNTLLSYLPQFTLTIPAFEVFTFGKSATEPFSAFADFNGDGVTNLQHYTDVVAASGGRVEYVAAATAGVVPPVPAMGLLGLGAIASLLAGGGAVVLRKRS